MIGLIYVIIAQVFWALEIILVRKFFPTQNSYIITAMTSIIASVCYAPFLVFFKQKFTVFEWVMLIILSLTSLFFAQIFYVKGIQQSPSASVVAFTTLCMPLIAAIMSIFILKEPFTIRLVIGGLVMVVGFLIISFK